MDCAQYQEFYNCLRQGYGVAPKIWSFCTFEFTVHSALFLAVCKQGREEILRSEEMEKRKRKCCVETCKTTTNQTGSNKAECTVNSRVQRNQILDATPGPGNLGSLLMTRVVHAELEMETNSKGFWRVRQDWPY